MAGKITKPAQIELFCVARYRSQGEGNAIMFLSFADGAFAALAVLPVAMVFLLAYGNPVRRFTRPSVVRVTRRRRRQPR